MNSPNSPNSPNPPQPPSDRTRLKELLAIPERDRTDEQWDEINQLEISLAPGNRERGPEQGQGPRRDVLPGYPRTGGQPGGGHGAGSNNGGGQPRPGGGGGRKPGKRFHNKPKGRPQ